MSLSSEDLNRLLGRIVSGKATLEQRADVESHLGETLMARGLEAGVGELEGLADFTFVESGQRAPTDGKVLVARAGDGRLVVELGHSELFTTVIVSFDDGSESADAEPDPRHTWFYDAWVRLIGEDCQDYRDLDEPDRTVALVAQLEADVMNGGIGQYLANTDGRYLAELPGVLDDIGAELTRDIVNAASALRTSETTWEEVWETRSDEFESLDDGFLDSGEDLAALVADYLGQPSESA